MVSAGSLPGFRRGTKPAPNSLATGAARVNPLASIPTTLVMPAPRWGPARAMISSANVSGWARTGVMSLKITPGSGKSGTSRTSEARSTPKV